MIEIMPNAFFQQLRNIPSRIVRLEKGALVFERGDPVQGFHRVVQGKVHLLRRQMDGATFILQRAGAGDILAEASLSSANFHCAAEVLEAGELEIWPAEPVRRLLRQDLRAAEGYALHLAAQLRNTRMRAEILSLRRVGDRLDAWLVWHGDELPPKGNWQGMAHEIGVSPEALYRELGQRRKAAKNMQRDTNQGAREKHAIKR